MKEYMLAYRVMEFCFAPATNEEQQQQQRQILEELSVEELWALVSGCAEASGNYPPRLYQDIVNAAAATHIDSVVEYGHYHNRGHEAPYDGVWTLPLPEQAKLVAEAKMSTDFTFDVEDQPGRYIEYVRERDNPDSVTGLLVIGDDKYLNAVTNQVRGSDVSDQVRVITAQRFFDLVALNDLNAREIAEVLTTDDWINLNAAVEQAEQGALSIDYPYDGPRSDDERFWNRVRDEAGVVYDSATGVTIQEWALEKMSVPAVLGKTVAIAAAMGLLKEDHLPLSVGPNSSRYFVHTTPEHENGDPMNESRQRVTAECYGPCNRRWYVSGKHAVRVAETQIERLAAKIDVN